MYFFTEHLPQYFSIFAGNRKLCILLYHSCYWCLMVTLYSENTKRNINNKSVLFKQILFIRLVIQMSKIFFSKVGIYFGHWWLVSLTIKCYTLQATDIVLIRSYKSFAISDAFENRSHTTFRMSLCEMMNLRTLVFRQIFIWYSWSYSWRTKSEQY